MRAISIGRTAQTSTAAAWTPETPGNVVAWYFASTGFCFEDAGATDPCEDNDAISRWTNRASVGSNTLATGGVGSVLFQTAGWNGNRPTSSYDGASAIGLSTGTMLTDLDGSDTAFTLFATLQSTAANADQSIFCWDNTGGTERINIRTDNAGNNLLRVERVDFEGTSAGQSGSAITTARRRIAVYFAGTTVSTWIDGTADLSAAALNVGTLATVNRFRIGNGASGFFTGIVSEFAVYTGNKSAHVANYQAWSVATWGG